MPRRLILVGARYRVTIVTRPRRQWPYHLRIRDRTTGVIVQEILRGVTIRQRNRAYDRAAERERVLNGGAAPPRPPTPWPEFVAAHLADVARRCRPATLREARSVLRLFAAAVAPAFLEVVTSQEIRRWLGARAVAASTRNKYRRTLHAALAWAVREGLLVANPCDGIPLAREDRRPAVILARPEDRRAFFAGMDARGAAWGAVARLAYAAGLRAQELGHLTWRSVDLAERYLLIQPEPAGGGCRLADWSREWGPKNHQLAALALDNESVARLASLRRKAVADLVQGGMGAEGAERLCAFSTARAPGLRVFGNANPDGFGKAFRRACREVCEVEGLPPIRPHGLRKTFGTVLAGRGMGEFQLAQVMRHANPQTTRDYYVLLQQRQTSTEALRLLAIEDNVPHKKGKRA